MHVSMTKKRDEFEHLTRTPGHADAARLALPRVDLHERRAIVAREWPVQKPLTYASVLHCWPWIRSRNFTRTVVAIAISSSLITDDNDRSNPWLQSWISPNSFRPFGDRLT